MKMRSIFGAVVILLLAAGMAGAIVAPPATVPGQLSYEGRLTDKSGNPITTSKAVVFTIYDAATAGTSLWTESQNVTPNSQGIFSVLLGSTLPLSSAIFNGDTRYIEINVGGETITPRSPVVSVGYALTSELAQNVADKSITRGKVATGQFVKQIIAGNGLKLTDDEGSGTGLVTLEVTAGLTGPQGPTGEAGPAGPQGLTGEASTIPGPKGATGEVGVTGPQGPQGIQGVAGLIGPTGEAGATGATGEAGSISSLTNAHILVGNASNKPTDVAMSGDISITNAGVTAIGSGKVTNTMLATGSIDLTTNKITGTLPVAKGGTNLSSYVTGDILYASGTNTLGRLPVGSAGQILKVSSGHPAWVADGGTGTVTQVNTGNGLVGGPVTTTGTISVDAGTTANKIVQLDSSAKLPAVNGSALTGLTKSQVGLDNVVNVDVTNASNISSGTLANGRLSNNVTVQGNTFNGASQLVKLNVSGKLPAVDGSALTGITVSGTAGGDLTGSYPNPTIASVSATKVSGLARSATIDATNASNVSSGTLADARLSTNVTAQGNTFNGASQLVKLSVSGKLPAVDGSALTGITVSGTAGGDLTGSYPNPTIASVSAAKVSGLAKSATIDATNASNVSSGTLADARLSTNVTAQGNTFNGASQLVKLSVSGKLPAVDGSALTGLTSSQVGLGNVQNVDQTNAANITSGTLDERRGGTAQLSYSRGDILYASSTYTLQKLSAGQNGQVLKVSGGIPTWSSGAVGPQGPTGEVGPQGPIGLTGATGAKGDKGDTGATGVAGATGPIGLTGATGAKGDKGDTGAQGEQGIQGVAGPVGPSGEAGSAGPQGLKGDKGDAGAQGEQGIQGVAGLVGPMGPTGEAGKDGAQGLQGIQGVAGPVGPSGEAGLKGDKGDTGAQGPIGLTGVSGEAGPTGATGAPGAQGIQGLTGPQGPAGPNTPIQDATSDLGTSGFRWNNLYLSGTATAAAFSGSGANLTGLTKSQVGLSNVENAALSTWAGSTNLTTLGTITTGTVPVARVSGLAKSATIDATNASNISTGTIETARLGSGIATNSRFLRGDQTWISPVLYIVTDVTPNQTNSSSLGTEALRWNYLFVNNIDATGSVTFTGTATAAAFSGNGSALTNLGVLSRVTVLTTASTSPYTVPAGVSAIEVELVGGGGGGGGGQAYGNNHVVCGGGGGGGAYTSKRIATSGVSTYTFVVGTGGSASGGSSGGPGAGTQTTFNSGNIIANGGSGGTNMPDGNLLATVAGGAGGTAGTSGDINLPGGKGGDGYRQAASVGQSGAGGGSFYGFSVNNQFINSNSCTLNGEAGSFYGAGGAGGASQSSGSKNDSFGGGGANGVIIIHEYK